MLGEFDFWTILVICVAGCHVLDSYFENKYGRGKDDE